MFLAAFVETQNPIGSESLPMQLDLVDFNAKDRLGKLSVLFRSLTESKAPKSLDSILVETTILANKPLIEGQLTMKSVLLKQPKILSKVIPRFESKLGAGRLLLRWATRKSQVQYFEKSAEFD